MDNQALALTLCARTFQFGHTVWGNTGLEFKRMNTKTFRCSCFPVPHAGDADADFCHLIALNEVRDSIDAPAPEIEAGANLPG